MKTLAREIQQRFNFIDRTLTHAILACQSDASVPNELKDFIRQLDQRSGQVKEALLSNQLNLFRKSVDDLAKLSDHVQKSIPRPSNVNYEVKSAVIMAHLEIAALKYQVH
ncbi:MAG TPA: hypothetical protein VIF82_03825 [Burkholderiaceae bacterium]|jgi:hypothetical protein